MYILILVSCMYYINVFFVYSIFGFFFESIIGFFRHKKFSSGILYGPWTPIYGIGSIIIIVCSNFIFNNLHLIRWREICLVFFVVMFILTFIEWLGGIIIEKVFHVIFWNYEDFDGHIGKYIAVEVSLLWGILSLLFIYFIHPSFNKYIRMIPEYVTYSLIILLFIDYFFTFIKYKDDL